MGERGGGLGREPGQRPSALSTHTLSDPLFAGDQEEGKEPREATNHTGCSAAMRQPWVRGPAPDPGRGLGVATGGCPPPAPRPAPNRSNRNLASCECREKPSRSLRRHHCSMWPPRRMRHLLRRASSCRRFSCRLRDASAGEEAMGTRTYRAEETRVRTDLISCPGPRLHPPLRPQFPPSVNWEQDQVISVASAATGPEPPRLTLQGSSAVEGVGTQGRSQNNGPTRAS